ncbi:hypothetical protein J6590_015725 [Homalodisca vitripennis]|nr:hypothetical protein J6590_015725 [Homalodisca vitripennis]
MLQNMQGLRPLNRSRKIHKTGNVEVWAELECHLNISRVTNGTHPVVTINHDLSPEPHINKTNIENLCNKDNRSMGFLIHLWRDFFSTITSDLQLHHTQYITVIPGLLQYSVRMLLQESL